MRKQRTATPADLAREQPERRDRLLTVRLTASALAALEALAHAAKVGHATLARLVLEKYIEEHAPSRRRK